jgi:tRNA(adenine34) deaminase
MIQVLPEFSLVSISQGMTLALAQARKASLFAEVPVGAIVVKENRIIAVAHNEKESQKDPTAHAELLAIRRATQLLGDWRLEGCTLISTLEPCPMCLGAILHARCDEVVYGALDHKWGACVSKLTLDEPGRFNHTLKKTYLPTQECGSILTDFFKQRRSQ